MNSSLQHKILGKKLAEHKLPELECWVENSFPIWNQ